jgi:mitogen-activated protein kinase kinase 1
MQFALKEVNVSISSPRDQLKKELRMHNECGKMQNIVDLHDVFYEEGRVYLVLELMSWGSLEDLLKAHAGHQPPLKMDEPLLAYTMREVLTALNYLHAEHKLVHRDVKPGNILLNHMGEVKLSDFGTARLSCDPGALPTATSPSSHPTDSAKTSPPGTVGTNFVGTMGYMSPQQLNDEYHSYRADVWSLGIVALECAAGQHPYLSAAGGEMNAGVLGLVHRVVSEDPPTAAGLGLSADFDHFVESCLKVDERQRSNAAELLQHEFIRNNHTETGQHRLSCWLSRFEREEDDEYSP